jgi:hypothetical protein
LPSHPRHFRAQPTIHPKEATTIMFNIINIIFTILLWTVFGAVIWAIAPIIQKLIEAAQHVHHFFQ